MSESAAKVGVHRGLKALAAPVLAMWVLAAFAMMRADAGERSQLFFGETWNFWYVVGILIPTAVGSLLGPRLVRW